MEKYRRNKDKLSSKIQDEIVMVDINLGQYFSLNGVGASIWEHLEHPHSLDEICTLLMDEYEIDLESCKVQTESFLQDLLKLKLIEKVNE